MSSAAQKTAPVDPASYLIGVEGEPGAAFLAASVRDVLLRINTVRGITGLSVPTIYRLMSKSRFPRPVKITNTARAWRLSEIRAWVDSREQAGTSAAITPEADQPSVAMVAKTATGALNRSSLSRATTLRGKT
jgi:prophage regulatory protein